MTTTTLSSSQSLTAGYGILPASASSVTLNTLTYLFYIGVKLTNGAKAGDPQKPLRVYVASSPYTSTDPTNELKHMASFFELKQRSSPGSTVIYSSPLQIRKGDTVYVWYEVPNWAAAGTVSAICYELN